MAWTNANASFSKGKYLVSILTSVLLATVLPLDSSVIRHSWHAWTLQDTYINPPLDAGKIISVG